MNRTRRITQQGIDVTTQERELLDVITQSKNDLAQQILQSLTRQKTLIHSVINKSFGHQIPEAFWKSQWSKDYAWAFGPNYTPACLELSHIDTCSAKFTYRHKPLYSDKEIVKPDCYVYPLAWLSLSDRELAKKVRGKIRRYKTEQTHKAKRAKEKELSKLKNDLASIQKKIEKMDSELAKLD